MHKMEKGSREIVQGNAENRQDSAIMSNPRRNFTRIVLNRNTLAILGAPEVAF
jgi:hypothetical protein